MFRARAFPIACLIGLLSSPAAAQENSAASPLAAVPATAPSAQDRIAAPLVSDVTILGGALGVDSGIKDRIFGGVVVNYYSGDLGLHADVQAIDREEDGVFGAVGASFSLGDHLRPRVMIGTSTNNDFILPTLYLSGEVQYFPVVGGSTIITPSVAYRRYADESDELLPALDVVQYFNIPGDKGGYYAARVRGLVSITSAADNGYGIGAGIQTVRNSGFSAGLYGEAGRLVYDTRVGIDAASNYYVLRPSAGIRIGKRNELFIRGEYADTGFYKISGGLIGLKFGL